MQQKLNAIVLSKLKYGDNDLIIKSYTHQKGVVSFFVKNVLKRKKGNIRIAHFQQLSLIDIEATEKPNQNLWSIKEIKIRKPFQTIHTNIYKSSIAIFIAEILSLVLKEEESNNNLFDYLESAFLYLDQASEYSNFHLLFLLNITKFLGFYPEFTTSSKNYFNLSSGTFSDSKEDLYCISGEELTLLNKLKGTNFDTVKEIKISSKQRQAFLSMLLLYFELHLGDFKRPKSLEVFNQVFS